MVGSHLSNTKTVLLLEISLNNYESPKYIKWVYIINKPSTLRLTQVLVLRVYLSYLSLSFVVRFDFPCLLIKILIQEFFAVQILILMGLSCFCFVFSFFGGGGLVRVDIKKYCPPVNFKLGTITFRFFFFLTSSSV